MTKRSKSLEKEKERKELEGSSSKIHENKTERKDGEWKLKENEKTRAGLSFSSRLPDELETKNFWSWTQESMKPRSDQEFISSLQ